MKSTSSLYRREADIVFLSIRLHEERAEGGNAAIFSSLSHLNIEVLLRHTNPMFDYASMAERLREEDSDLDDGMEIFSRPPKLSRFRLKRSDVLYVYGLACMSIAIKHVYRCNFRRWKCKRCGFPGQLIRKVYSRVSRILASSPYSEGLFGMVSVSRRALEDLGPARRSLCAVRFCMPWLYSCPL